MFDGQVLICFFFYAWKSEKWIISNNLNTKYAPSPKVEQQILKTVIEIVKNETVRIWI